MNTKNSQLNLQTQDAFFLMRLPVDFIESLYETFQKKPQEIDPSWRYFFEGMEYGQQTEVKGEIQDFKEKVFRLIEAYRTFGFHFAKVNPLSQIQEKESPLISPATYGFYPNDAKISLPTFHLLDEKEAPLDLITKELKKIYCGSIGFEFKGFLSPEMEKWMEAQIEPPSKRPLFSVKEKKTILQRLNEAELFETFLHTKYVGQKRFSLEGAESLIPMIQEVTEFGSEQGAIDFVIGMPHRGRLNIMANVLKKSLSSIFSEFEEMQNQGGADLGTGDVKYHKGYSATYKTANEKEIHVSLTPNPSHLESVDAVVEGKTKAKQVYFEDNKHQLVIPILIHGDAAIAGQGVVYECLQLYHLEGYSTGGTLHIVVNNQIGFTTLPRDGRSTPFCTDIAKAFSAPIFHVNAEDPEACIYAIRLALKWRQAFHGDVFIDLNCYRKYGHNESDEPAYTQPLEYQLIKSKKTIRELYRDQLIAEKGVEKEIAFSLEEEFKKKLRLELEELKLKKEILGEPPFKGIWKQYHRPKKEELFQQVPTGVNITLLQELTKKLSEIPQGFSLHPKIEKLVQDHLKKVANVEDRIIDWAFAEQLSFASLLYEKNPIRFAGQDSRRGTFSQRHSAWVDQKTGNFYYPLQHVAKEQGRFDIIDSPLSEYAALAFEYGYSLAAPSSLVIWEAQFGDFANGAQILIDQYLCSSEQKWSRYSGLVVLLPHGYEGQGSEHSSARIERFLQLCAQDNLQVTYPTTPSQYFHLLRRQVKRSFRRPLIVFTPKGLLRHSLCQSSLKELSTGAFAELLDDPEKEKVRVKTLLLCSGKIFFELLQKKEKDERKDLALVRLEQLYPFHEELYLEILNQYPKGTKIVWFQEEPENMGAFSYLFPFLKQYTPPSFKLDYICRKSSSAPASGSHKTHEFEQENLIKQIDSL